MQVHAGLGDAEGRRSHGLTFLSRLASWSPDSEYRCPPLTWLNRVRRREGQSGVDPEIGDPAAKPVTAIPRPVPARETLVTTMRVESFWISKFHGSEVIDVQSLAVV